MMNDYLFEKIMSGLFLLGAAALVLLLWLLVAIAFVQAMGLR